MIALLILAMALSAISFANNAAMSQVARVTRMTTASFLMEGVVNDIHAYYQRKGFPSNSLEDRECELPRDFADMFTCRYDLKAMNLTPDQMTTLVQAAMEQFTGGAGAGGAGAPGAAGGSGAPGASAGSGAPGAAASGRGTGSGTGTGMGLPGMPAGTGTGGAAGGLDLAQLAILAPLFGPQGQDLIQMCNINLGALLAGVTGLVTYMPMIIDMVAKRTRQLNVVLEWSDGPRKQRELRVQTFIVSLPEEEVAQMKEAEKAQEIQEAIQSTAPGGGGSRCVPACTGGKKCVGGVCK
jgi:hypothetical protein